MVLTTSISKWKRYQNFRGKCWKSVKNGPKNLQNIFQKIISTFKKCTTHAHYKMNTAKKIFFTQFVAPQLFHSHSLFCSITNESNYPNNKGHFVPTHGRSQRSSRWISWVLIQRIRHRWRHTYLTEILRFLAISDPFYNKFQLFFKDQADEFQDTHTMGSTKQFISIRDYVTLFFSLYIIELEGSSQKKCVY